ncbi:MAG: putative phage baseplate assembly protein [Hyphomonadaceae bacterium]|nr:MAG: putative phage baseplate assembly protein [Hyphomonadaceae bacterium]
MPASTPIDLSKLPVPTILDPLDYDALLAELIADFRIDFPQFVAAASDPITKALEIGAYRRVNDRQLGNEKFKQWLVAFANGSNLDHLGAIVGAVRLQNEIDDDFRARIVLAPEGFSVAGPKNAYEYHARSAHSEIADVRASSPAPGEVLVVILPKVGAIATTPEILAAVSAFVNSDDIRPMTDLVNVVAATIVEFSISATLTIYHGPDSSLVLAAANASLEAYLARVHKIGHDITKAGVLAALFVPGVQNVVTNLVGDIVISDTQVGICTGFTISVGGEGE